MVVMMWLIWSESIRNRKPSKVMYAFRVLLFAAVIGVMIYNVFAYPHLQNSTSRILVAVASCIGVIGIVYFLRRIRAA